MGRIERFQGWQGSAERAEEIDLKPVQSSEGGVPVG